MARDYYSVLKRATAALDPDTAAARRAVYDRARHAVIDAGLPMAELRNEQSAIEAAIERIEAETQAAATPPLRPRSEVPPSGDGATGQPRTARSPEISRSAWTIAALATASVAIAAIAGYAFWPRSVSERAAPAQATRDGVAKVEDAKAGAEDSDPKRPYIYNRQVVYYRTIHPVGTIVIAKSQRFLYLVRPNVAAVRYSTGVGRECMNAVGLLLVSAKEEWPERPPQPAAEARRPPTKTKDNAEARFGARSLALGDTGHRIHGTHAPTTAGEDGCFPLVNNDIIDLHDRVPVGTRVVIN
jgi:lipoprotein-anchoring transpeptidase ErfK/SrfK